MEEPTFEQTDKILSDFLAWVEDNRENQYPNLQADISNYMMTKTE